MAAPTSEGAPYDALAEAKLLLRTMRSGALATLGPHGAPFASLTAVATLPDGRPILLLSRLAAHTRHLDADSRCSLLLSRGGKGDPLAHPRLTLCGQARRFEGPEARARYLRRQPKAALYAGFADFGFFVLDIASAHLNGGFARAAAFGAGEILTSLDGAEALLAAETDALDHLNAEHRPVLRLIAEVLCQAGGGAWRASGLDPEGLDLACGDRVTRWRFDDPPPRTPAQLSVTLSGLAARARQSAEAETALADKAELTPKQVGQKL